MEYQNISLTDALKIGGAFTLGGFVYSCGNGESNKADNTVKKDLKIYGKAFKFSKLSKVGKYNPVCANPEDVFLQFMIDADRDTVMDDKVIVGPYTDKEADKVINNATKFNKIMITPEKQRMVRMFNDPEPTKDYGMRWNLSDDSTHCIIKADPFNLKYTQAETYKVTDEPSRYSEGEISIKGVTNPKTRKSLREKFIRENRKKSVDIIKQNEQIVRERIKAWNNRKK